MKCKRWNKEKKEDKRRDGREEIREMEGKKFRNIERNVIKNCQNVIMKAQADNTGITCTNTIKQLKSLS